MLIRHLCTSFALFVLFIAMPTRAQTVNLDFEGAPSGDVTYAGDDGVFSSPGGTTWNGIGVRNFVGNLLDEFGNPTSVGVSLGITITFGETDPSATNVLQDSGFRTTNLRVSGLDLNAVYDIAVYVMLDSGLDVVDATGSRGFKGFGAPTYNLPGVETAGGTSGDYVIFRGIQPVTMGRGGISFLINTDGAITGLQLVKVPEPAAAAVLLLGITAALRRR